MGKLFVVGLGPGKREYMTQAAVETILESDLLIGYTTYIEIVKDIFSEEELAGKEILATGMKQEMQRCITALARASEDAAVSMVCSGDSGVYGMAALVLELAKDYPKAEIHVVAGVTAALAGGAVLGAPLGHDFSVISLSDLLTSRDVITERLLAAAKSDMVICLYNPSSKGRSDYLKKACEMLLRYKSEETVCGVVRQIGREGQAYQIMSLKELAEYEADMFTTVFVGNRETRTLFTEAGPRMVTPRGYGKKYGSKKTVLLFGGTTEGHELTCYLAGMDHVRTIVCVATDYGKDVLTDVPMSCEIRVGRLDASQMEALITAENVDLVIDATHPHAVEVTHNIKKCCRGTGVLYHRVERMKDSGRVSCHAAESIHYVASASEAAQLCNRLGGGIYLTCGSKELPDFTKVSGYAERCFVRVLPSAQVMQDCKELGYLPSKICGMQGPFSYEMNLVMFKESGAGILVTKDSGKAGGFEEKIRAAAELGMQIIVIEKDGASSENQESPGMNVEETKRFLAKELG